MILFIALFVLWVILNGKFNLEIAMFGIVLSAALTWFSGKYLGYGKGKKYGPKFFALLLEYFLTVIVEIFKANIAVLKIVWSKRLNFEPCLVYFKTDLKEDYTKVILANSITITPGTITVILDHGTFCVHCLDKSLADGIADSSFVKQLLRLEEA